jgi:flagellar basal-body rod protein FlgB
MIVASRLHYLWRMFDAISQQLERYMDLVAERQKLVVSNIANSDTPGYRTKDIDFQFEFQSSMAGEKPDVIEQPGLPVKNDGNDVNLEREARLLSENDLRFTFASSTMRSKIKTMQNAITETQG